MVKKPAKKVSSSKQAASERTGVGAPEGAGRPSRDAHHGFQRDTRARADVDAAGDDVTAAELIDEVGSGGETHQRVGGVGGGQSRLTTQQGIPVSDDQNTLKAGDRGPSLLEDLHFREKIFHFDHERIPERVVHAQRLRRPRLLRAVRVRWPT